MKKFTKLVMLVFLSIASATSYAQQVEVQGELKVTQMPVDDTVDALVIKKTDGTLGTRSVASLPPPAAANRYHS